LTASGQTPGGSGRHPVAVVDTRWQWCQQMLVNTCNPCGCFHKKKSFKWF